MKKYSKFAVLWTVNVVLIYLAVSLMPASFTLGNSIFTSLQAAVFTGFVWNYVLWNAETEFKKFDLDSKNTTHMMFTYLALNFVTLWLLARFSFMTGFGISSFVYVFILAFVANFVQYMAWKWTEKK